MECLAQGIITESLAQWKLTDFLAQGIYKEYLTKEKITGHLEMGVACIMYGT